MLTGTLLYGVFFSDGGKGNPQTMVLAMTVTLIPVAGVAEQALAPLIGVTLALGIGTGVFVSSASRVLFPDRPMPADMAAAPAAPGRDAPGRAGSLCMGNGVGTGTLARVQIRSAAFQAQLNPGDKLSRPCS